MWKQRNLLLKVKDYNNQTTYITTEVSAQINNIIQAVDRTWCLKLCYFEIQIQAFIVA